jgi:hypothetical protein
MRSVNLALRPSKKLAEHRRSVMEIENFLKQFPQEEVPVKHTFGAGVYCREMRAPADTVLTGMIHRYESMVILVSGTIVMGTPDGPVELTGPLTFPSPAGTKNVAITKTEVIWINVMVTDLTDVGEIEKEFFVSDFATLELEDKQ